METQEQPKFAYDEWIEQVRPDVRTLDQLTLLQGFIGRSSESDHVRVYSDEALNNFVEVPEEAIVHAVKVPLTESALGGSKLWLRADAVVTYGDPKVVNRPKSTFLEGDLFQQYATQYGAIEMSQSTGAGPVGQFAVTVPLAQCGQPKSLQVNQCSPLNTASPLCPLPKTIKPPCTIQVITKHHTCAITTCNILFCKGIPNPYTVLPTVTQTPAAQMSGQADTTYMGGYYGMFNPYTTPM